MDINPIEAIEVTPEEFFQIWKKASGWWELWFKCGILYMYYITKTELGNAAVDTRKLDDEAWGDFIGKLMETDMRTQVLQEGRLK